MNGGSTPQRSAKPVSRRRIAGVTLIELMVALAIGSFLLVGAVTVFVQSRASFRVADSISRMQENARFAFDELEPDVRMAHYWGLTSRTHKIQGRAGPNEPIAFAVGNDCGPNWAVNLDAEVGGTNNGYAWQCSANGGAQPQADTLVVRRAAEEPSAAAENTLQIQSAPVQDSRLFVGDALPAGYTAAGSQTHRLVVNGYYVSPTSSLSTPGNAVPSLRRKTLVPGPRIEDREVLPGVEDMQVQLGVDTDAVGSPNRGTVNRYVNPGDPVLDPSASAYLPDAEVLAVRIWLRLRTEEPETGFTDTASYSYADRNDPPPEDGYRRIVVSRTIYIRNARPPA